jgi:uncharacterized protein (TIGR02001 family)
VKQLACHLIAGVVILSTSKLVFAEEGILSAENFSANVGFTTNYLFRGETQTNDNPAIQGGIDWSYESVYLGLWGSNVDFQSGDSVEIDYYGGLTGKIDSFTYDLGIFYYTYPGANDDGFEFDYIEFIPSLNYTFDSPFKPSIYVHLGYSPDYFGEEGAGINIEGGISFAIDKFGIDAAIGNQWIDGDTSGTNIEWLYYNIGVTSSAIGFDLDLRFHAAEENGIDWLANDNFPNDEFVTFSINRSF